MGGWMLAAALALASAAPAPDSIRLAPAAPAASAAPFPTATSTARLPLAASAGSPPAIEEVMALPAGLRQRVAEDVVAPSRSASQRLQRLMEVMFGAEGLGMKYEYEATWTVDEAYLTRKANCLTFTLLFIALAREAGLDAYAQEINDTLAWHQQDNTIYRTNHVNAGIRIGGRRYTVDVASDFVIARDPPERVSDQRLLSHYYNNRAAELLTRPDLEAADRHMAIALQLDPDNANSWSNQGVVHLRKGDLADARLAYRRALELSPAHSGALFNMVGLLERVGDARGQAEYRSRLHRAQKRDPFHQFLLATDHEQHGRATLAVAHYRRAIRLYDREHRFHLGLARAYLQLGESRRAERALRRAQVLQGKSPGQGSESVSLAKPR